MNKKEAKQEIAFGFEQLADHLAVNQKEGNAQLVRLADASYRAGQRKAALYWSVYFLICFAVFIAAIAVVRYTGFTWTSIFPFAAVALTTMAGGRLTAHRCEEDATLHLEALRDAQKELDEAVDESLKETKRRMKVEVQSDDEPKEVKVEVKRGRGRPRKNKEDK